MVLVTPLTVLRMEAAWRGDVARIKALTLQPWGSEQDQPPLMAAIKDHKNNAPFSLAFLRGHIEAAKAILKVIQTQWSPKEKDEVRYKIEGDGDDDDEEEYSDEDNYSDDDSENHVRVVSEKVDKKYTIENIGQVSLQVKSHTKPAEALCLDYRSFLLESGEFSLGSRSDSLFAHVIKQDDMNGLKILLELGREFSEVPKPQEEDDNSAFTFKDNDFILAVQSGNTQALRQIIKQTGAGIPLDSLVKKSGVQIKQKPRYYQGLTVYGKKRYETLSTHSRSMLTLV